MLTIMTTMIFVDMYIAIVSASLPITFEAGAAFVTTVCNDDDDNDNSYDNNNNNDDA